MHTHTPFLKDTSTCGGILAEFISPPLSLCLLGGYSTSRSCVWLTVGFTVCLPSSRKRRENATFSPTYIPVTHFLKNTSLSWSLLWGNDRRTCWCHLCPSAFTNECAMLYYSPTLDSQVCMCVCVWPATCLYEMPFTVVQSSPGTCSQSVHRKEVKNLVHWTIRLQNQLQDSITSSSSILGLRLCVLHCPHVADQSQVSDLLLCKTLQGMSHHWFVSERVELCVCVFVGTEHSR